MSKLRVALVVPDYSHDWDDDGQFQLSKLTRVCHAGHVDLVIFPEAYEEVNGGVDDVVADWAGTLQVPVLMGVEYQGFQLAAYRNPSSQDGESASHLYVKHSTAKRLAYEWPDYVGPADPMFRPINLKGERVGVEICHDMYYGLVGHRLRSKGADVLVDLTAGNVNMAKWKNVVRARSLESGGPFLCTMGRWPEGNGSADAMAYRAGRRMVAAADTTNAEGYGGFAVFDLGGPTEHDTDGDGQTYSDRQYEDITISLGPGLVADVVAQYTSRGLEITGPKATGQWGNWKGFETKVGSVGVLPLSCANLADPVAIHRQDAPSGEFDHHFVLYHSASAPANLADAMTLMKLRAIEHRVGVVLLAGDCREVLKTNRYKNIQRFVGRDGIFGVNAEFLGGTWSTAGTGSMLGIPVDRFEDYRSLLR